MRVASSFFHVKIIGLQKELRSDRPLTTLICKMVSDKVGCSSDKANHGARAYRADFIRRCLRVILALSYTGAAREA